MRLTRVFYDADLRCNKVGLTKIARDAQTPLEHSTVIFFNRKLTMFKLLVNGTYCTSFGEGKRIPLEAIEHLPQAFGGSAMQMQSAIRKAIAHKLAKKSQKQ